MKKSSLTIENLAVVVNIVFLLSYISWDVTTFWSSPAHGSPPVGIVTVFASIAHSGVLAVIALVFSLLRKDRIATFIMRLLLIMLASGVGAGVLLVGIWILKEIV